MPFYVAGMRPGWAETRELLTRRTDQCGSVSAGGFTTAEMPARSRNEMEGATHEKKCHRMGL